MKVGRLALIASLAVGGWAAEAGQHRPDTPLLVKAARLLDARAGAYRTDYALLVINGRIARVGPTSQVRRRLPAGTETVDLGRATLLPGLIDAHAHLLGSMDGRLDVATNLLAAIDLGVPSRIAIGTTSARSLLNAGITTVRNLGHSGTDGDIRLRDAISSGSIAGPRILAAGRKITPPGGQAFGSRPVDDASVRKEFIPVANTAEASRAARELIRQGADVVKIVTDDTRTLPGDIVAAIVKTAHAAHVRVAAHATTAAGIAAAIDGGVDSIEHGTMASDAMLMMMREKHIVLVPTPYTADALRDIFIADHAMTDRQRADAERDLTDYVEAVNSVIRRAQMLHVTIVAGSDMWWTYPRKNRGEATKTMLHGLAHAGLSPAEVIRAATIDAAALLGWGDRIGSLEPGRYADIIAAEGDPLADLAALDDVTFVMKGGTVVKTRNLSARNGYSH